MNRFEKVLDAYMQKYFAFATTRKIANNTLWLLLDRAIKMVVGTIVGLGVAKYLGPKQYGNLSYGLLYFSMFLPVVNLGIDSLVVRDLSKGQEDSNKILGSIFITRIFSSVLGILVGGLAGFLLQNDNPTVFWIIFINLLSYFFQPLEVCDFVFQTKLKSKYSSYARTSTYLFFSLVKIFGIFYSYDLNFFVWVYALELAMNSLVLFFFYQFKFNDIFQWKFDFAIVTRWLKESPLLIVQGLAVMVQGRFDQFMLEKYLDKELFGEYALASRLVEMSYFLPAAIFTSVAPRMAETKYLNENAFYEKLKNLYKIMTYLFVLLTVGIVLTAYGFIGPYFDGTYSHVSWIMALLCSRLLYINLSTAKTLFYVNTDTIKYSLYWVLIGTGINVVLNLIFIPIIGIVGAILAMNITAFLTTFVFDAFIVKTRKNNQVLLTSLKEVVQLKWAKFN